MEETVVLDPQGEYKALSRASTRLPSRDLRLSSHSVRLSQRELKSIALLILLYLLQGVPIGLTMGALPFILKSQISYGDIGIFTLSSYPYSLKLIWSPLVDGIYSPRFGRRKSWIVPAQILVGLLMILISERIDRWLSEIEYSLYLFSAAFFLLVVLCASQDIAVDGWALDLLSDANMSFASTAQTIGLNTGYLLSFTVLLALASPEFANKYVRAHAPTEHGLISIAAFIRFWGFANVLMSIWILTLSEKRSLFEFHGWSSVLKVYNTMIQVVKLKQIQIFIAIHLIAKVGFVTNDAATNLSLLEKGFRREDIALIALIDFPFEIFFSFLAAKWSQGSEPLRPWRNAFVGRLIAALFAMFVVRIYSPTNSHFMFWIVVLAQGFSNFMGTVQFVSISAFHSLIADPVIGGTYMTLLNTICNFGGIWPRYFIFRWIDYLSNTVCIPDNSSPIDSEPFVPFICDTANLRTDCIARGGMIRTDQRGYFIVNSLLLMFAFLSFRLFISTNIRRLERLPLKSWKVT